MCFYHARRPALRTVAASANERAQRDARASATATSADDGEGQRGTTTAAGEFGIIPPSVRKLVVRSTLLSLALLFVDIVLALLALTAGYCLAAFYLARPRSALQRYRWRGSAAQQFAAEARARIASAVSAGKRRARRAVDRFLEE